MRIAQNLQERLCRFFVFLSSGHQRHVDKRRESLFSACGALSRTARSSKARGRVLGKKSGGHGFVLKAA
jgi:hypothetical protein